MILGLNYLFLVSVTSFLRWMSNLLTTGSNVGFAVTTDSSSHVFNTSKNGDKSVIVGGN